MTTANKLIELCTDLELQTRELCVSAIQSDMQVSDRRYHEYNNLWKGASSADKDALMEFMTNRWANQIKAADMTVIADSEVATFNISAWDAERFMSFDELEIFIESQFKSLMDRKVVNLRMNISTSYLIIALAHKLGRYSGEYVDDFIALITSQYAYIVQHLDAMQ